MFFVSFFAGKFVNWLHFGACCQTVSFHTEFYLFSWFRWFLVKTDSIFSTSVVFSTEYYVFVLMWMNYAEIFDRSQKFDHCKFSHELTYGYHLYDPISLSFSTLDVEFLTAQILFDTYFVYPSCRKILKLWWICLFSTNALTCIMKIIYLLHSRVKKWTLKCAGTFANEQSECVNSLDVNSLLNLIE